MSGRLVDPGDSLLAIVDAQAGFLDRVDDDARAGVVERIAFLAASARFCGIPIIATVESPEDWGGLHPALAEAVGDAPVLRKDVFGLADDPRVGQAVAATGRGTVVLTGLETDVCIAQSALGLIDRGTRVVVVTDAVASPGNAHAAGLERMRSAGAVMVVAKQLHYEWMRTVERSRRFSAEHPLLEPPGVLL
ncbi:MAG TPA: isochorismatase family protein [Gaiellales bacterium]|nr:isochorismatase family protein [Gaiellales bacterium]